MNKNLKKRQSMILGAIVAFMMIGVGLFKNVFLSHYERTWQDSSSLIFFHQDNAQY